MRPAGGNHAVLRKYVDHVWRISTDHFDPNAASKASLKNQPMPLDEILVQGSTYSRRNLKHRLFDGNLRERKCELCGQDEIWRGNRMSLILDHINGVPDDNRLENLRLVCPNCAATLETHCGRKNRMPPPIRACKKCGRRFTVKYRRHAYCSRECAMSRDRSAELRGRPTPDRPKVTRPPFEQLIEEIEAVGYSAVGRKYGVSDNAVRKWVRFYERQIEREAGENAAAADGG
jgi:hypothetical protein